MITDRNLGGLRIAATLTHLHPTLATRLDAGGRTVVQVDAASGGPLPPPKPGHPLRLTPCQFRASTARAWAERRRGRRLQLLDIEEEPTVELVAAAGDRVAPSGIVRVRSADVVTHAFGTFLGPDRCRDHGQDLLDDAPTPEGVLDLFLRRDADLDVTIVSVEADPEAHGVDAGVHALLEALLARFATIELLDTVAAEASRP